jgi:hypothetical protein
MFSVRPSHQNTKLVKQGSAGDYVKYNMMVMGKLEKQLHLKIKIYIN